METVYDREKHATAEYVQRVKLQELFSHLLQLVAYAKPENPRAFMAEEVRKLQQDKPSGLFEDEELTMMFDLIDVTKQRTISLTQLKNAYANLSYDGAKLQDADLPAGVLDTKRVTPDEFKAILGSHLQTTNHWAGL